MAQKHVDVGIVTVIPTELQATKAAFGVAPDAELERVTNNLYLDGSFYSHRAKRDGRFVLLCIGVSGNAAVAAAATEMVMTYKPKTVVLVGIAAGVRGKVKIGDVVVGDRVVAYESASLKRNKGKSFTASRADAVPISRSIGQDIVHYISQNSAYDALFLEGGGHFPIAPEDKEEDYEKHVARSISFRPETIASGEKLFRDPTKIAGLETIDDRIKVVEMEAVGVSEACRQQNAECLIVRGISDFGDEFKSDEFHSFAARAAACVAAHFIAHGLDLPKAGRTTAKKEFNARFPFASGIAQRILELNPASSEEQFPLEVSFGRDFEDVEAEHFVHGSFTPEKLLKHHHKSFLIHAPGGSGKTTVMASLADEAVKKRIVPFFYDLSLLSKVAPPATLQDLRDCLLDIDPDLLEKLLQSKEQDVLLLVDGLNELDNPVADGVVELLTHLQEQHRTVRLVITDRMVRRQTRRFWHGTVASLSKEFIERHLPPGLSSNDLEGHQFKLLSTPFFLDLQMSLWRNLKNPSAQGAAQDISNLTRIGMFDSYFRERVGLSREEWATLLKAAFSCYAENGRRPFKSDWWESNVSSRLKDRLKAAGLTVRKSIHPSDNPDIEFRHQLIHDFLVAKYLTQLASSEWNAETFDIATSKASNSDPICFAAEILGKDATELLIKAWDWNYKTVNKCLTDLHAVLKASPVSPDFEFVVAAKNAENRFSYFEETTREANDLLQRSRVPERTEFAAATSMEQVLEVVEGNFHPSDEAYKEWKMQFVRRPDNEPKEEALLALTSTLLPGWTAANAFRRTKLSNERIAQIRMLYYLARSEKQSHIEWKAAHVLGAFSTWENAELLIHAATCEGDDWARSGALRSLMELASRTVDTSLREFVIQQLLNSLQRLKPPLVLREIRRNCLVRGAKRDKATQEWYQAVLPLVKQASEASTSEHEGQAWEMCIRAVQERAGPI